MKNWIGGIAILLLAGAGVFLWTQGRDADRDGAGRVRVERGSIVRYATAVGRVEAEHEVPVESLTGGILTEIFVRLGQKVKRGDPLAEVRPVLTTMNVVQAERALEAARENEASAKEFRDGKHLAAFFMRLMTGEESVDRLHRGAERARRQAEEQLALLKEGKVVVEDKSVDYTVRAPVDGHVLVLDLRKGDPVVPSSSYGAGTVLMTLADMDHPVFRGTVDEIDVGRLRERMQAGIRIGALPGEEVSGTLKEIALKARSSNNAVVFDVRIDLEPVGSTVLRSGYSAVAKIGVDRRDGVLILPERTVEFRDGKAFVLVPDGRGGRREAGIETGLSDGLTLEVLGGLSEGDEVFERISE